MNSSNRWKTKTNYNNSLRFIILNTDLQSAVMLAEAGLAATHVVNIIIIQIKLILMYFFLFCLHHVICLNWRKMNERTYHHNIFIISVNYDYMFIQITENKNNKNIYTFTFE